MPHTFKALLEIIGINPFVFVPEPILEKIFERAGKTKGQIPVSGKCNGNAYTQTLVRYAGAWRLYINTKMLPQSPQRIGETITISIEFDPKDRSVQPHPDFDKALRKHKDAKKVFDQLPPSRQKEILRYINDLKSDEAKMRNIEKAIGFLKGENRFVGRDKP
jgi:Bacteriocin-protection, YdeI or OmpD-Associated/Domain of unknown function (DUF1905)